MRLPLLDTLRSRSRLTPRLAVWLLALALLAAQGLARLHQVVHVPGGEAPVVSSPWGAALFGEHEGSGSDARLACQSLDHLASDLATAWALPALPPSRPALSPVPAARAERPLAFSALYRARAPPPLVV